MTTPPYRYEDDRDPDEAARVAQEIRDGLDVLFDDEYERARRGLASRFLTSAARKIASS